MDVLPLEIIELILSSPLLSIQDVVNFSATCAQFQSAVQTSNEIWKRKYLQKWPQFEALLDPSCTEYYDKVRYVYGLKQRTRNLLNSMAVQCYKRSQLSEDDFKEWLVLLGEQTHSYFYIISDLMDIVNSDLTRINSIEPIPLNTPGNKTQQYYATLSLRYLKQHHLRQIWEQFINLPVEKQIAEKAAVIVAQWCQPKEEITYDRIAVQLDHIAELVKNYLFVLNPRHSIFSHDKAALALLKVENINAHLWNSTEREQVLKAMQEVIFNQLGFHGNNEEYYNPENSFINKVLEKRTGIPITIAIVYESVARRLGIRLEPISFPRHFLVRFTENPWKYYYLDVFNGARIINPGVCPYSRQRDHNSRFPVATVRELTIRMANNLHETWRHHGDKIWKIRSILEFSLMIDPNNLQCLVHLAKLYMLHNIDTKGLQDFLISQHFESSIVEEQAGRVLEMLMQFHCENDDLLPVDRLVRPAKLEFAVGMVMQHNSNYKCVIHGWDSSHRYLEDARWEPATLNINQPFYHVVDEEGTERYVAQDELTPINDPGGLLTNELVGRYFSHFFVNHFVPNEQLERDYRSDTNIRHKYYQDYVSMQQRGKLYDPMYLLV